GGGVAPAPDAPGLQRRTVLAGAAWSIPILSVASATPAFANASQASIMTIAGPASGVPASGAVPVTVTVKDAQGQPQAGQPVSFTGPEGSTFDAADGVTNCAGQYTANFNLNKPWPRRGRPVR
ncbi:Ig-like domain-containing protein, partial [Microbacterium hydrothermale]|uniref:Ig-like domain-containing protein n=1 Tax=Microbacterium hydrothermale TaxID=857427 RepID=UPI00197C0D99